MKQQGFTLIELLIVIAIIGILATLVIVQFGGTRTSARDAKRVAFLNQMQTALEVYQSKNGYYPRHADIPGGSGLWDITSCNTQQWDALEQEMSDVIKSLPVDPSQDCAGGSYYLYRSLGSTDGGAYKVYAVYPENPTTNQELWDPSRDGGDGWPNCTFDGSDPIAWAVYSETGPGSAMCW